MPESALVTSLIDNLAHECSGANARVAGDDATVRPDRRSIQRTALRPTDHRFVRELVHELQTELAGSGEHDGRPRHFRDAYNNSPVGPALPAGVREALATLRSTVGGSWRMDETY